MGKLFGTLKRTSNMASQLVQSAAAAYFYKEYQNILTNDPNSKVTQAEVDPHGELGYTGKTVRDALQFMRSRAFFFTTDGTPKTLGGSQNKPREIAWKEGSTVYRYNIAEGGV